MSHFPRVICYSEIESEKKAILQGAFQQRMRPDFFWGGTMRSAGNGAPKKKLATARQKQSTYSAPAPKAVDASRVRMQIVDLITANAVALVEATIQEAMHGHYPAMKCLLEIAGLADPKPFEQSPDNEGLAQVLLRQLGLPGETVLGNDTTGQRHMEAFRGMGSLPLP